MSTPTCSPRCAALVGEGSPLIRGQRLILPETNVKELKECFGVFVESDFEGLHPSSICVLCRQVVSWFRKAVSVGHTEFAIRGGGCGDVQEWTPHCTTCLVCSPPATARMHQRKTTNEEKNKNIHQEKHCQESSSPVTHRFRLDSPQNHHKLEGTCTTTDSEHAEPLAMASN